MSYVLTCRTDRTDKNNLSDIHFLIHNQKDQYRIPTGEKCKPSSWDKVHHKVSTKGSNFAVLNSKLKKHASVLDSILEYQQGFDIAHIRARFKAYLSDPEGFNPKEAIAVKPLTFSEIIDKITSNNRNQWSYGHLKKFKSLRSKILLFDPEFEPSKLNNDWYQRYIDFCRTRNNAHNTIHTDLKVFAQLLHEMNKNGIKVDEESLPRNFPYIEPRIEALTWEEVAMIATVDLSKCRKTMEDSRYLWLVGAYTGLRWSDLIRITPNTCSSSQIADNEGTLKTIWHYKGLIQKTKKQLQIPLLDEAVLHLQKRNFVLPIACMQVVNRDIKEIAKLANIEGNIDKQKVVSGKITDIQVPKYSTIHIHTGRHSYAWQIVKKSRSEAFADIFLSHMLGQASHATSWKYMNFGNSNIDQMFLGLQKKEAQL